MDRGVESSRSRSHPLRQLGILNGRTRRSCHVDLVVAALSATLEVLHGALVLLGGRARLERAEVSPFPGLWIDLPRVESILARRELSDHDGPASPSLRP